MFIELKKLFMEQPLERAGICYEESGHHPETIKSSGQEQIFSCNIYYVPNLGVKRAFSSQISLPLLFLTYLLYTIRYYVH